MHRGTLSLHQLELERGFRVVIDGVRYDIEARWRTAGDLVGTSERKTWRELLKQVVESNSNYEVYVTDLH